MTLRALAGLVVLNAGYLIVGSSLLWAVRGFRSRRDWALHAGLAYMVGVASLGVLWSLLLVASVPLTAVGLVAPACLLVAVGVAAGRVRGRNIPGASAPLVLTKLSLISATGVAATGLFFEAVFRGGRLQGLYAYDAWAFWVPKAKAIYESGHLDIAFLAQLQLPSASYPPLVPLLDAAAFHAMGSPDVVTLHLQHWFYAVGFVSAVAGLMCRRVPGWILWPFIVLTLVAPRTSVAMVVPQADFLLQSLFCVAVVLAVRWLREPASWHLPTIALVLGACTLTKREGLLLAAIVVVALGLVSADRWRTAWPRIAAMGLAVAAVSLPWRLWYRDRGLAGESPPSPLPGTGRLWDSAELSLDVLFDLGLWSVLTVLLVATLAVATLWGDRRSALFVGAVAALVALGGAWASAAFPGLLLTAEESLNPVVRYTVALALLAGVASPLLLAGVWERTRRERAS